MKRLIFLKIDLIQIPGSLTKSKSLVCLDGLIEHAVKKFKKEISGLKQVKYLKDYLPKPQVLIEFDDNQYEMVYHFLCQSKLVDIIDSVLAEDQ